MIKVIVAGTRTFSDYELLKSKLDYVLRLRSPEEVEIVCGSARGADSLGEKYAKEHGMMIRYFRADWINMIRLLVIFVINKWLNTEHT